MPTLNELAKLGQAVWLDYVDRPMVRGGQLQALVDQGVTGVTANPTILDKAISSADYDDDIRRLAQEGLSTQAILDEILFDDIGLASDTMLLVNQATGGADGLVSLELDPRLAHNTAGTIAGARQLFGMMNHPNLMIKVPATREGIPAIKTLIGEGININITLIFSQQQYQEVVEAYLSGLENRLAAGQDISGIASVASFFLSRIDTQVDKQLQQLGNTALQGKIAIASAKVAYAYFLQVFNSPRWERLSAQGARVQRPLWASTGTKNPKYPDTMYVDTLIGPDTVNTLPLPTLKAWLDHGRVDLTLLQGLDEARAQLAQLDETSVDLGLITYELTEDGVRLFIDSWDHLLAGIDQRRRAVQRKAA